MPWRQTALFILLLGSPRLALAEAADAGCQRLVKLDQEAISYNDQEYMTNIDYSESGKLVKNFQIRVVTKGLYKALVSFTAPGEMRGTRVLIVDAETMYSYLPEFGRIRRIAGHSRRQSFMGTNMYYEDITERRYSDRWDCRPVEATAKGWVMDLSRAAGSTSAYTKLRLSVSREHQDIDRIEYYEDTRHTKSQIRENWKTMNGVTRASIIRFVSHDHDAELEVEYTSWRVNIGIPESAFTKRALLRDL